jgi:acyl-CoA synthetase (AMP-forming)/AMP-acid ligase II
VNAQQAEQRALLKARVFALIDASADGTRHDDARDALLRDLHAYQLRWVAPYANFCAQSPGSEPRALPCDAFRFARISSRAEADDVRRFLSSGTTQDARSAHVFADLSLYERAAEVAARHMLFPEGERMQLMILAPRQQELPESSLSFMLARFEAWFGAGPSDYVWPLDAARVDQLCARSERACQDGRPLVLLGTSFAFVHALDLLGARKLNLPQGSRIMQTGGFKGRSRELSPAAMRALLSAQFGVPDALIVAEYGMTELSSQLYETPLRSALLGAGARARRLWAPPWLRVRVVDPERQTPLPEGREGLVRIDDAANLDSVCAIQTADLGVIEEGELVLRGRAQGAVLRGCSISAEQLLRGGAR